VSRWRGVAALVCAVLAGSGCGSASPDELDQLGTVKVSIGGAAFRLWIADDEEERARGLMHVTPERLRPLVDGTGRGMIFVYESDEPRDFWMKDTYVPLDLANLDAGGTVVDIHTMTPLDERRGQSRSARPACYAIVVIAGCFRALGLRPGDRLDLWQ
jgi:uncharacterized membrane protein (UPF0127 family)